MNLFSSKFVQAIFILSLFFICIVLPSIKPDTLSFLPTTILLLISMVNKISTEMYLGIFHINSIVFVGVSALVLYLSINRDIQKAQKRHKHKNEGIKEVEDVLENYFFDKITLEELRKVSEKNKTLRNLLSILDHGGIEEDFILEAKKLFSEISFSYEKLKNDYEYLATVMPIIGMVGTIAGLLIMFAEPTQAEDFEKKFAGLSLALSTTLYASLITILLFKPSARSVEHWQLDLEKDLESLEISIQRFYHKLNLREFVELPDNITAQKEETKDEETKK